MFNAALFFRNLGNRRAKTSKESKEPRKKWSQRTKTRNGYKKSQSVVTANDVAENCQLFIRMNERNKYDSTTAEAATTKERVEILPGGVVNFKEDHERFQHPHTLKLKTDTLYNMAIVVDEHQSVSWVVLGGKRYNLFHLYHMPEGKKMFVFVWCTSGVTTTQRKHRSILPCIVKLKGWKEVNFKLSVKFYEPDETIHCGGHPLTSINVKCNVGTHSSRLNDVVIE